MDAQAVRVAVFIDWQNTYKTAREAFGWRDFPNEYGNYSPYQLAAYSLQETDGEPMGSSPESTFTVGFRHKNTIRRGTRPIVAKPQPGSRKGLGSWCLGYVRSGTPVTQMKLRVRRASMSS